MISRTLISRDADHPFHEMLGRMHGIPKYNDISALHVPVRHEEIREAVSAIAQLIDQKIVADEQRVLHGFGGNLKGLHDKSDDKDGDDYRGEQRLQGT